MKRSGAAILIILAISSFDLQAEELHLCDVDGSTELGWIATTSGKIESIPGGSLFIIDSEYVFGNVFECFIFVQPKEKIPAGCKAGNMANATGVVRRGVDGSTFLVDAKIKCARMASNNSKPKQRSLCDAQHKAKRGSIITTWGSIYKMNKDGFLIKDGSSCSMLVYLKGKIPADCKVGQKATVTGEIAYDVIGPDLHEATAKCGGKL